MARPNRKKKAAKRKSVKTTPLLANDRLCGFAIGWLAQSALSLGYWAFKNNSAKLWEEAEGNTKAIASIIIGLSDRAPFSAKSYEHLLELLNAYGGGGVWGSIAPGAEREVEKTRSEVGQEDTCVGNHEDMVYVVSKCSGEKYEGTTKGNPEVFRYLDGGRFYPDLKTIIDIESVRSIRDCINNFLEAAKTDMPSEVSRTIYLGQDMAGLAYSKCTMDIIQDIRNLLEELLRLGLITTNKKAGLLRPVGHMDSLVYVAFDPWKAYRRRLQAWWNRDFEPLVIGSAPTQTDIAIIKTGIQKFIGKAARKAAGGKTPPRDGGGEEPRSTSPTVPPLKVVVNVQCGSKEPVKTPKRKGKAGRKVKVSANEYPKIQKEYLLAKSEAALKEIRKKYATQNNVSEKTIGKIANGTYPGSKTSYNEVMQKIRRK